MDRTDQIFEFLTLMHAENTKKFDVIESEIKGLKKDFFSMDQKMDRLEQKVDLLDQRVDRLEQKVDLLDQRVEHVEINMVRLDQKMERLDQRVEHIEINMVRLDQNMTRMEYDLKEKISILHDCVQGNTEAINGLSVRMERVETRLDQQDMKLRAVK